ncbi:hypothetical protein FDI69_gp175 [Rhodococcus phage Trina]|uniref:Uncharacterized protein n=1 Tax=Rhodococcus phage Trina TaxID=2027905 RepID=A0A2D0ZN57_9CAUD|nr:hypothetical protein FDI69_gp175 [Rhodococcus phage Trina]ASZ75011.1 hypothetical protein SEA_TRINA_232 [Rhodococcus phage Trina]
MAFTIFMLSGAVVVFLAFLWAIWPMLEIDKKKKPVPTPAPPEPTGNVLNLPFDPMESARRALSLYTSPVGYLWQLKYSKAQYVPSSEESIVFWIHLYNSDTQQNDGPGMKVSLTNIANLWEESNKSKTYAKGLEQTFCGKIVKYASGKRKEKQIEVFEEGIPVYVI